MERLRYGRKTSEIVASNLIILPFFTKAGTLLQFECSIAAHQTIGNEPDQDHSSELWGGIVDRAENAPLFQIPRDHQHQYAEQREDSPLGRVFSIANRNQDHIDALVVIGSEAALSGIRALVTARCDPYHNETDRATRGSKPRLYFLSETSDNDTVAATMDRLTRRSLMSLEQRFATLLIVEPKASPQRMGLAEFVGRCSIESHQESTWPVRPPLVVVGGKHIELGESIGSMMTEHFLVDASLTGPSLLLTPAGLLPLAFLGLNCIKLLEGAIAVSEAFAKMPADHWITRQALLLAKLEQCRQDRIVAVHREVLEPLARWITHLESRDRDSTLVIPRDLEKLQSAIQGDSIRWIHHLDTVGQRHDTFSIHQGAAWDERVIDPLPDQASRLTLPALEIESLGRLVQGSLILSTLQE